MTYRDDDPATRAQRDALERELSAMDPCDSRHAELAATLRGLNRSIEAARTQHALFAFSNIRRAASCTASWEGMAGDDRVRRCALCEKNVYDIAGLTAKEVLELFAAGGEATCARLFRRRDGTVMTADCGRGRHGRRLIVVASAMAVGGAVLLTSALTAERGAASPKAVSADIERFEIDEHLFFGGVEEDLEEQAAISDEIVEMLLGSLRYSSDVCWLTNEDVEPVYRCWLTEDVEPVDE